MIVEDDTIDLPLDPARMLDFMQQGIIRALQEGLSAASIIATFHDYSCYWLHATTEATEPHETNKRLN